MSPSDGLFAGGGQCGALLRSIDWTGHPLGRPETWPGELRNLVRIILNSEQPMFVLWGSALFILYNDACAATYGRRHPEAMGSPFRETLSEVWNEIAPFLTVAMAGRGVAVKNMPFTMNRSGFVERTYFSFSYTPVLSDRTPGVLGVFCTCYEVTADILAQQKLEDERTRLRGIFETALGAVAVIDGPDHVFSFVNPEYEALIGRGDLIGRTVREALPELVDQGFDKLLDKVYATGEPYVGRAVPVALRRSPGGALDHRMVDLVYHPICNGTGGCEGIFVHAIEVTEQHLLNRELAHRLKNQLSVVQAIVGQSLRGARSFEEVAEVLGGRLSVLARAHDTIIDGGVACNSVAEVVRSAIEWQGDRNIVLDGPAMPISARPALSLSLIVHELLTNAVKYGALAAPTGRVDIAWTTRRDEDRSRFLLSWRESGGPPVVEPARRGSGTRLIQAGLSGSRDTDITLVYDPAGLRFELSTDLTSLQADC